MAGEANFALGGTLQYFVLALDMHLVAGHAAQVLGLVLAAIPQGALAALWQAMQVSLMTFGSDLLAPTKRRSGNGRTAVPFGFFTCSSLAPWQDWQPGVLASAFTPWRVLYIARIGRCSDSSWHLVQTASFSSAFATGEAPVAFESSAEDANETVAMPMPNTITAEIFCQSFIFFSNGPACILLGSLSLHPVS